MIQSYSASLNSLGNPRIYGSNTESLGLNNTIVNNLYSRFVIERNTTGIAIYITPETTTTVNAANTNTANTVSGVYASLLSVTGLTVIFQNNRFEITGNLTPSLASNQNSDSSNALANLVSSLLLKDVSDNTIETQVFALSINHSNFLVKQSSCFNKLTFNYLDSNYDYANPIDNYGLADRGTVEYQYQDSFGNWISVGTSKIESGYYYKPPFTNGINGVAFLTYDFCDVLVDTPLRAIRTVRAIPNCGGTSPIIYQSISPYFIKEFPDAYSTLMTTIPYIPSATFDGSFACCVSEDSEIEVTPLTLTPNRNSPHNIGIANALKYDLYINDNGVYDEVIIIETKSGQITVVEDSDILEGYSTISLPTPPLFLTELTVGSKIYTSTGIYIGTVKSIESDSLLTLEEPVLDSYDGGFKSNSNYFINPTTSSVFTYTDIIKGTYKLIATYNNACTSVSKEWIISICNSTIINTGTCNNPSIQNLSAINYARFTLTTYNGLSLVDSVTQETLYENQIVSTLSTYQFPKLDDGFYRLDVDTLDEDGVKIGETESQILFFDCNIKSCEVYLRSNLLGFSTCVDCVDKKANQKEYETLKLKNDMFQIYKDIIYSYWNNIKKQESIDETWDIEDHLQEVTTYSNALKQIQSICTDCGFSFDTNTGTLSSGDCGCNG